MRRIVSLIALTMVMTAVPAAAQLSATFADYFDGPEGYLLTNDEAHQWKQITDDKAAEAFIALFWAKRDVDLTTPINEFRQDFKMRVEAADANFGYGKTRGAMSDRGHVLIVLGRFSRRDVRAAAAVVGGGATGQGSAPSGAISGGSTAAPGYYDESGATEIWEYETSTLPVKLKQKVIFAIFKESKIGLNDFILDRALRENTYTQKLLLDIPEILVVHPELTDVPRFGLLRGTEPASTEQITWLDAEAPWPEGAKIVSAEGLVAGPRHFAWASLFLPSSVARADTLIGRLRSADSGSEIGSFVLPADPQSTKDGARYEVALPLESGSWTVDLALAAGSEPLAVTSFEVETTPNRLDGTMISPIYWGTEVEKKSHATLGDPFNVGGWHLISPEQIELTTSDTINFMWYVLNPDLDEAGNPSFETVMSLYKDGKRVMRGSPKPAPHSEISEGLWMCGSGVPLEIFREPGEFKLKVEVKQTSDSTKREGEFLFVIPENGQPEAGS